VIYNINSSALNENLMSDIWYTSPVGDYGDNDISIKDYHGNFCSNCST